MNKPLTTHDLELFYEKEILPFYNLSTANIKWQSHDRIGNDVFAHYLSIDTLNYALVFEDFPSESHFISTEGELILTKTGEQVINMSVPEDDEFVENRTGYFSLYRL